MHPAEVRALACGCSRGTKGAGQVAIAAAAAQGPANLVASPSTYL